MGTMDGAQGRANETSEIEGVRENRKGFWSRLIPPSHIGFPNRIHIRFHPIKAISIAASTASAGIEFKLVRHLFVPLSLARREFRTSIISIEGGTTLLR